jgi:hypothetical protein
LLTVSMKLGLKVAVTDFAALMVTEQVVPETELQPVQPPKVDPLAAAAVSVTVVPLAYGSEQSAPQLIPAGVDVTVPLPAPGLLTVSVNVDRLNAAVTARAAFMATVQVVPDTESQPLQLPKTDPPAATAVSVTLVPLVYGSEQSAPQLIPAGLDVTVPLPAPGLLTDSVKVGGGARLKVAVTVRAAVIVTVHVAPDDELHPVQLANVDPDPADAVRVTVVPLS